MTKYIIDSYPVGPLQRLLQKRLDRENVNGAWIDRELGFSEGSTATMLRHRPEHVIRSNVADEWAIRLGLHPAVLWPEWFSPEKCSQAYRKEYGIGSAIADAPWPPTGAKCPHGHVKTRWSRAEGQYVCGPCNAAAVRRSKARRLELAGV